MMDIPWTKQLSVGNRIIDSAHKELLGMVNRMGYLVKVKDCSAITEEFKLLEERLCAYFAVEESIAQAVKFPFAQHKLAHQNLLDQFQRTRYELMSMNVIWSDDDGEKRCCILRDRLVKHFKEESARLKLVLDTHLYDLQPG
jgi:hemerythrin-like metal-binding protein